MNIQIFGTPKCFDTKKAERYFKERNIRFQSINLLEKPLSPGEFNSICQAVGGIEQMIDSKAKDYASIAYLADEDKAEKLLASPQLLKTPIVRNGKLATIGYKNEEWKKWEAAK